MSPLDASLIRRKLGHIAQCLDDLRPLATLTLADYRARLYERKAAERLLHEAIEAVLDINAHVITEAGGVVPDDYYGGFIRLGELGVLPPELARALAPSAGLRNRLVHEYEGLDDSRVLASIGSLLALYPRYIDAVETHIQRLGQ